MNYKMKPKCIDLFCGAGGLTYGLRKSGVDVVAGIDLDPACEYSYRTNNAGTVFWPKDIEKVTREDIEGLFEGAEVRVLAGCAPCQPFSTYSQRYDQSRDGKWALLSKFGDLVAKVEPEIVTMENVPSILTHRVLQDFISTLREKEYEVWC
jgi:DNA (cytosine-5)-methyltransferase 1